MFLCRECEKDFDGDGVPDSEDVSLDFLQCFYISGQGFPALNVSVEKFCNVFSFRVLPHAFNPIPGCLVHHICPENKKI